MMFGSVLLALSALAGTAVGHMQMTNPPPLGSSYNPHTTQAEIDYNMISPLGGADGSLGAFPCRGHLNLLGTAAGASVATWATGSSQSLSIGGSAYHNGGSCQAMLSFDQGATWTVIKSWIGNCPTSAGGTFSFVVPADTPTGSAIFGWSWFNHSGNREMYHNCASITITGGGGSASTPFSARPAPFIANIPSTTCATIEGGDVTFPNPGPDVENTSSTPNQPVGDCAKGVPNTGGGLPVLPSSSSANTPDATSSTAPEESATVIAPPQSTDNSNNEVKPTVTQTPSTPSATTVPKPGKCKRYRKRGHPARMRH